MTTKTAGTETERLRKVLGDLLEFAERQECTHEDTYRGGTIWTICSACGQKWADDEGGFPGYVEPKEITAARNVLRPPRKRQITGRSALRVDDVTRPE